MSPIRIHLGHMPEMLRTIIDDLLAQEADLVVVGCSGAGEDPLLQARQEQADMLITTDGKDNGTPCLQAILSGPPLSILAIAGDGRDGTAVDLTQRTVPLGREGGAALADAVRSVVGRR